MPTKTQSAPKLYTVADAASQLGIGRSTLYRLIRDSKVPYRRMPTGVVRFTDEDIKNIVLWATRPPIAVKPTRRAA